MKTNAFLLDYNLKSKTNNTIFSLGIIRKKASKLLDIIQQGLKRKKIDIRITLVGFTILRTSLLQKGKSSVEFPLKL